MRQVNLLQRCLESLAKVRHWPLNFADRFVICASLWWAEVLAKAIRWVGNGMDSRSFTSAPPNQGGDADVMPFGGLGIGHQNWVRLEHPQSAGGVLRCVCCDLHSLHSFPQGPTFHALSETQIVCWVGESKKRPGRLLSCKMRFLRYVTRGLINIYIYIH